MTTRSRIPTVRILLPIILAAGLGALPAPLRSEDDLSTHPIRFAVLGDRTGDHQPGVFAQVVGEVERLKPEFVITVGDMIEGYTTDSAAVDSQWREFLDLVEPLTMPIYYTPGNHDITFDEMEPAYERFIGRPFASFDHRGMHVVILDNSRWDVVQEFPREQIAWLEDDLRRHADAKFTCVFFHQPYWYRTLADGGPDTLHAVFKANGVDAVFCGHFHRYFSGEFDGIKYTCVGSSGGATEPSPTGLLYHFAWVTVDDAGFHVAPVKMGAVLPWEEQSVAELRTIYAIENSGLVFTQPANAGGALTIEDAIVALRITNRVNEECEDTLRWEVPEGWSVEPAVTSYTVAASGTATLEFNVACTGRLFPVPEYELRLPYAEGRAAVFEGRLEVIRPVVCRRAPRAPTLDGELTDAAWARPTRALLDPQGNMSALDSVAVYFAYDESNLYMAVHCAESHMDSLAADLTKRDAAVYGEDCFGVMINPNPRDGVGYQIYINPLGTVYDQILEEQTDGYWTGDGTWDGEYEVETRCGGDYWTIEARLPLDQLGVKAKPGDTWRVNFRRKQRRTGSFAIWQLPWAYDPVSFGALVLE